MRSAFFHLSPCPSKCLCTLEREIDRRIGTVYAVWLAEDYEVMIVH